MSNKVLHKPTNLMVRILNFKPGKIQVMFESGDRDGEVITLPESEFDFSSSDSKPKKEKKPEVKPLAQEKKKATEKTDDDDVLNFMQA